VLLAEEDTLLQGMTDSLIYIGRCCGMEMNMDETKVIRISRQPSPVQIMIYGTQLENVEYFSYLGNMINYVRCTYEIKSRIPMEKQHSTRKGLFSPANWTAI
jgi:hypothetical protein